MTSHLIVTSHLNESIFRRSWVGPAKKMRKTTIIERLHEPVKPHDNPIDTIGHAKSDASGQRSGFSGILMRPAQNKRIRGRSPRKGPNPLTRSFESNGPDVKIRGTAQTVAEKYLQLARDAQSSGNTIMAESLLQHAEHYFRLIAAAQQPAPNGFGRQSYEAEAEIGEDDDDFSGLPDRFAPLSERLPQAPFEPPPRQPFQQAPQQHFAPQPASPQPQPFEERPFGGEPRQERQGQERQGQERQARNERFGRDRGRDRGQDRGFDRTGERSADASERAPQLGFDRNRERNRFQQRGEPPPEAQSTPRAAEDAVGLPAFITAPAMGAPTRKTDADQNTPGPFLREERGAEQRHEGVGYNLAPRRRRRPQPSMDDANGGARADETPQPGELPLGD